MPRFLPAGLLGLLCLTGVSTAQAAAPRYNDDDLWEKDYSVQALLGAVRYDSLRFAAEGSGGTKEVNFSTLPQLGGAWSTPARGDRLQIGLEATFLFGFEVDRINYIYLGGGTARVSATLELWLYDLAGGAYAQLFLGKNRNLRLYAAGGPLLMYADYRNDRSYDNGLPDEDEHTSAFGLGAYARCGVEFRTSEQGLLGLGVRGNWADIDLSDISGDSDLSGFSVFATYTVGL